MGGTFSKIRAQWNRSRASTAAPRSRSAPPAVVASKNEVPMVPSSVTGKLITVTGTVGAVGEPQSTPSSASAIVEVKDNNSTTTGFQIMRVFRSKDKCAIELIPLGADGLGIFRKRVGCWDDAGFKMSAMKAIDLHEVVNKTLDMSDAIGPPVYVKALDLQTCKTDDLDIEQRFTFEIQRTTQLCGVAGFFTLVFSGIKNPVTLSTAPWEPPTFWKQIVFFLPRPIDVEAGDKVEGKIVTTIPPDNSCKVIIQLTVAGFTQKYRFRK